MGINHDDPDYLAAWTAMNEYGGVKRTLAEVVLDVEEVPSIMSDIELVLNDLFLRAYLAGAKHGRAITYQAFVGACI